MNELHKKKEASKDNNFIPGAIPQGIDIPSTSELYYKKLCTYLLLLYQSYLSGETALEPEIKMALWRIVQLNEEFGTRIRLTHLDYLQKDATNLNAPWEEARSTLFPFKIAFAAKHLEEEKDKLIREYKQTVIELLALNP